MASLFGPSANSIISKINSIGIENIKAEAGKLFAYDKKIIPKEKYPEHIAKLEPVKIDLIHDGNLLRIILQEFNGTTETGLYIYKNAKISKRKYEIEQVDDRVSVYKKFD